MLSCANRAWFFPVFFPNQLVAEGSFQLVSFSFSKFLMFLLQNSAGDVPVYVFCEDAAPAHPGSNCVFGALDMKLPYVSTMREHTVNTTLAQASCHCMSLSYARLRKKQTASGWTVTLQTSNELRKTFRCQSTANIAWKCCSLKHNKHSMLKLCPTILCYGCLKLCGPFGTRMLVHLRSSRGMSKTRVANHLQTTSKELLC